MVTLNTFSGGIDTNFSTELNENFALTATVLGSETNATTWDTTDTTYTELATVDLTGITTSHTYALVLISVRADAMATDSSTYARPSVELKIGESGSETQVKEWDRFLSFQQQDMNTEVRLQSDLTLYYLHTLTSGEKTNGFNVIVNGKYTVAISSSPVSTHKNTLVIGIS